MTRMNAATANDICLPKPRKKPLAVLTQGQWDEMRDALVLALDALGGGPRDVDHAILLNSILNQRIALRIAHARIEKLKGAVQ